MKESEKKEKEGLCDVDPMTSKCHHHERATWNMCCDCEHVYNNKYHGTGKKPEPKEVNNEQPEVPEFTRTCPICHSDRSFHVCIEEKKEPKEELRDGEGMTMAEQEDCHDCGAMGKCEHNPFCEPEVKGKEGEGVSEILERLIQRVEECVFDTESHINVSEGKRCNCDKDLAIKELEAWKGTEVKKELIRFRDNIKSDIIAMIDETYSG